MRILAKDGPDPSDKPVVEQTGIEPVAFTMPS